MRTIHLTSRHLLLFAAVLMLTGGLTTWISSSQLDAARREHVVHRLRTAVNIVRDRAETALTDTSTLSAVDTELRTWGRVTGMRLTLIRLDGSVLADTEVEHMPNLADRPEVRAALEGHSQVESRRSVMTGKESLYVAIPIERAGQRVGTLRAATDASEVREALPGFEKVIALIATCCVCLGVVLGLIGGQALRARGQVTRMASPENDRLAA